MLTLIHVVCLAAGLALAFWGARRALLAPSLTMLLIIPVIVTNPYDNLIIALGAPIGQGPLLEALSWPRYLLHVLTLPFWIVAAVTLARQAGVRWAAHPLAFLVAIAVAAATLLVTLTRELLPLDLTPLWRQDLLVYVDAARAGPPLGPLVLIAAALICGLAIWRQTRWPWLALATFYVLVVAGLPFAGLAGALVNIGEVLMGTTMLAAEARFRTLPVAAPAPIAEPAPSID